MATARRLLVSSQNHLLKLRAKRCCKEYGWNDAAKGDSANENHARQKSRIFKRLTCRRGRLNIWDAMLRVVRLALQERAQKQLQRNCHCTVIVTGVEVLTLPDVAVMFTV